LEVKETGKGGKPRRRTPMKEKITREGRNLSTPLSRDVGLEEKEKKGTNLLRSWVQKRRE